MFCLQQYYENRLRALAAQKEAGSNPYPHKFEAKLSIPEYVKKYESLNSGDHLEDVEERIAGIADHKCDLRIVTLEQIHFWLIMEIFLLVGRLMNKRSSSSKLFFYDLHGGGAKVQVMADARYLHNSMIFFFFFAPTRRKHKKFYSW